MALSPTDGDKTFTARITDAGSNSSTSLTALVVDYDTTVSAPANITLNLVDPSDTFFAPGTNTDNITKLNSVTIEVFFEVAKAEVGDTIELYRDSVLVATTTIVNNAALTSGMVTFTNVKLDPTDATDGSTDGNKVFTAKHLDKAGNSSSSAPANDLTITYDTTVNAAADLIPDLLTTSDSVGPGGTDLDNITKEVPLTIRVTFVPSKAKLNDTIELLIGGSSVTPTAAKKLLDSVDLGNGYVDFALDASQLQFDGNKVFSAKHTDTADNSVTSAPANNLTVDKDTPSSNSTSKRRLELGHNGTKSLKGCVGFH